MMQNEILVLGAGACGLMAGSILAQRGYRVIIIEARDRIGGRINTVKDASGFTVDYGAEFVHGDQPLTAELIKQAGARMIPVSGEMYQIRDGQKIKSDFFDDEWERLLQALNNLKEDTDLATFLQRYFKGHINHNLFESVKAFVEGYDAADMHNVSAFALREEWSETNDDDQAHIEGGYGALIDHLYQKLVNHGGRVVLSSVVEQVAWSKGKVKLLDNKGTIYESERVIITVPLGVLKNNVITFTPHLMHHKAAFNKLGFGGVIKFLFEFRESTWDQMIQQRRMKNMSFIFSDAAIPTWWSQYPKTKPLLTGWLGGPSTYTINHDPDSLFEKATSSLSYIFDMPHDEIKDGLIQWHIADWVNDPYTRGAYSYQTLDTLTALEVILTPVEQTIFFAGEAFYKGKAMGTVEAALASGRDVANQI